VVPAGTILGLSAISYCGTLFASEDWSTWDLYKSKLLIRTTWVLTSVLSSTSLKHLTELCQQETIVNMGVSLPLCPSPIDAPQNPSSEPKSPSMMPPKPCPEKGLPADDAYSLPPNLPLRRHLTLVVLRRVYSLEVAPQVAM
jgi:hypothetical protein